MLAVDLGQYEGAVLGSDDLLHSEYLNGTHLHRLGQFVPFLSDNWLGFRGFMANTVANVR